MSKEYSFSVMPSVSISRSRFARKSQHKTSFNLGDIVPIYVDEVLPGDTRSMDMASLVRMSTPIAPIMDNIYLDFYAFFVPNRLVWEHWKAFMGENETSAGIPSSSYSIPVVSTPSHFGSGKIGDYFGLPLNLSGFSNIEVTSLGISALPFRGYALIYNEWFRNQNIIAPLAVYKGDNNQVLVSNSTLLIQKAAKLADYFTKGLPFAQKGTAVTIPLGTTAPIFTTLNSGGSREPLRLLDSNGAQITAGGTITAGTGDGNIKEGSTIAFGANLVADLSNATAASINQLRYAFQLQKLLEKDALYGSRYWEILAAHFGIKAPDASLQRPEYLGGYRQRINIDQLLE